MKMELDDMYQILLNSEMANGQNLATYFKHVVALELLTIRKRHSLLVVVKIMNSKLINI